MVLGSPETIALGYVLTAHNHK